LEVLLENGRAEVVWGDLLAFAAGSGHVDFDGIGSEDTKNGIGTIDRVSKPVDRGYV
jgi:hypothetical protein